MKVLERWVLQIADSDLTWIGFGWLRPAKDQRVGLVYILFSSILLGLPGMVMGVACLHLFLGRTELSTLLCLGVAVTILELFFHALFAHFWNRRATELRRDLTLAEL